MSKGLANQQSLTPSASQPFLVLPHPHRVAVKLGLNYTTQKEIVLNLRDHGALVTNGLVAGALLPTASGIYWESILPADVFESTEWAVRMRETLAVQSEFTPPVPPGEPLIRPNLKRLALIIFAPQSGILLVSMNRSGAAGSFSMLDSSQPVILNLRDHGEIVRSTFWLAHSVGNVTVNVWECLER